jgi:hypothetical protein
VCSLANSNAFFWRLPLTPGILMTSQNIPLNIAHTTQKIPRHKISTEAEIRNFG